MSLVADPTQPTHETVPTGETAVITSWKTPVALAVFTVLAVVLFVLNRRPDNDSTFRLTRSDGAIQLPEIVLPTFQTGIVVTILLAVIAAFAFWTVSRGNKVPLWTAVVFAVLFLVAFLAWASAGESIPIYGLLIGTVTLSVPLIFGALGGVISERVGVVNIAIEGQLLAGAFCSAVVASATGSLLLAVLAASVAGVLVSIVLAVFSIKYFVEQVIVGVVINVLVLGFTSFLFSQVLAPNAATLNNTDTHFERFPIPVLSEIPLIGPMLFQQTVIVYVMYIAVAAVWFGLFKTRWGLRVRAVGEHPTAADTVGINVARTRFWNVALAGAIVGFGGAFFTLGSGVAFGKDMVAGMGFIALAAVIFGRWDPIRATLAALLFGFATNLQNVLGIVGSPVPSEFMLMLPYVITIFAVAGLVGVSRPPAASGKPYIKP
jgi:ABC-type uncharacterized transport system permease subunit